MSIADTNWLERYKADKVNFARDLAAEMVRLAAQMQACATIAEFYFQESIKTSSQSPKTVAKEAPDTAVSHDQPGHLPDREAVQVGEESLAEAGEAGEPASISAHPDMQSGASVSGAESPDVSTDGIDPVPLDPAPEADPIGGAVVDQDDRPPQPFSQPAVPTSVQSEAEVKQGGDQLAQNEELAFADASAGRASAQDIADHRNSSREPAASSPPAAPAAGPRTDATLTKFDLALDAYAKGHRSHTEIAKFAGCAVASVQVYLSRGRREGDPRVSGPGVAGIAKPAERKPEAPAAPAPIAPKRLIGVVIDQPGKVISLDTSCGVIAGPLGDWQTSTPVIRIMARMKDGGLFDVRTLADIAPMSVESFNAQIGGWKKHLASIGVELLSMKAAGCKLRVAGE